jgi:ABC-type sugar transport system ATPase subunit
LPKVARASFLFLLTSRKFYQPEILDLSDRVLVAKSGTIAAEFTREQASAERILHAANH